MTVHRMVNSAGPDQTAPKRSSLILIFTGCSYTFASISSIIPLFILSKKTRCTLAQILGHMMTFSCPLAEKVNKNNFKIVILLSKLGYYNGGEN